jgi:2-deoxy-D-gluconate 3-dehydrogenase
MGIAVNVVAPGYIATEMNAALMGDENRAESILARISTGRCSRPDDFKRPGRVSGMPGKRGC